MEEEEALYSDAFHGMVEELVRRAGRGPNVIAMAHELRLIDASTSCSRDYVN